MVTTFSSLDMLSIEKGVKIVNEWRNIVSLFPEKCFVKNA
ncbi:hypothetical protein US8_03920 [Bacillus altitudinis]|nr:hypothetical protein US8_03920 [Bacillus altitudinis]